jgi:hypothetical protein
MYAVNPSGDTILDFSNCGYKGGGVRLPIVPASETVGPIAGDNLANLQAAIDRLSQRPINGQGIRGALQLTKGEYEVSSSLKISAGGIVVRGDAMGGTRILATCRQQLPLIQIAGASGLKIKGKAISITDPYVSVGARTFTVSEGSLFNVGDPILVRRVGNADWIHALGMDHIEPRSGGTDETKQWTPFNLDFDRVVTAVNGNRLTIDAPIACAIDSKWGGGEVRHVDDSGRIENVGIEDLQADSVYDPSKKLVEAGKSYYSDEAHSTYLVTFENVKNAWVKNVTSAHFFHGTVECGKNSKWITVQDSQALDPVSEITGSRRYTFNISGQLILMQRCVARNARHAFVVAAGHTCGPNVFLDCISTDNHNTSEPHQRWSVGGLYDNVDAPMAIQDRQWMGTGHGWAGANFVVWNCTGSLICQQPPTAQNYAIGFVGEKAKPAFPRSEGYWESFGQRVKPVSLYRQQLKDRLGAQAVDNIAF